ncbi:MAG: hypothetical protein WCP53_13775 [Verrucomicrobiota bacterium]
MKTPRELLLARHADARPRLDALRAAVLAELPSTRTSAPSPSLRVTLWEQLVVAGRPAWAALGAAWVLIFLLNTTSSATMERPVVTTANPRSPEVEAMLTAQRQLWVELTAPANPPPPRAKEPPVSPSGARLPLHRRDRMTTLA